MIFKLASEGKAEWEAEVFAAQSSEVTQYVLGQTDENDALFFSNGMSCDYKVTICISYGHTPWFTKLFVRVSGHRVNSQLQFT